MGSIEYTNFDPNPDSSIQYFPILTIDEEGELRLTAAGSNCGGGGDVTIVFGASSHYSGGLTYSPANYTVKVGATVVSTRTQQRTRSQAWDLTRSTLEICLPA